MAISANVLRELLLQSYDHASFKHNYMLCSAMCQTVPDCARQFADALRSYTPVLAFRGWAVVAIIDEQDITAEGDVGLWTEGIS